MPSRSSAMGPGGEPNARRFPTTRPALEPSSREPDRLDALSDTSVDPDGNL
jgi:hypothetical protein